MNHTPKCKSWNCKTYRRKLKQKIFVTSNDVRVLRTQKGQTIKNENFSKLDFLKLYLFSLKDAIKNMKDRDFPGGPVVKT